MVKYYQNSASFELLANGGLDQFVCFLKTKRVTTSHICFWHFLSLYPMSCHAHWLICCCHIIVDLLYTLRALHLLTVRINSSNNNNNNSSNNYNSNNESFTRSTAAVASSRMRTFVFMSRALAKQINWRWPTLRLPPPSETSC